MRNIIRSIFYVLIALLLFLLGYGLGEEHTKTRYGDCSEAITTSEDTVFYNPFDSIISSFNKDLDLSQFWHVWAIIKSDYFYSDSIDTEAVTYGAIYGLVQALDDPYSMFLEPDITTEFMEDIEGEFEGIGAALYVKEGLITIEYTLKGSPAMNSGLQTDDIIYKIDDEITTEMTLTEAVNKIRGEKGTDVILTILREDTLEPLEVTVTRDTIEFPSVTWEMIEDTSIAYISINRFVENTNSIFEKSVNELLQEDPSGIILDLRFNPGGYLDQSIEIIGHFIPKGVVVKQETKTTINEFNVDGIAKLEGLPVVVLINGSSASASEIVAGALHDYGVAELVGETTFGKGSIQDFIPLEGGASLKITTAKWLTPNGVWVTENPLEPDYEVKITLEDLENNNDPQLDKAIELLTE